MLYGLERDNLHKDNKTLLIAKDDKKRKNHELRNKLADATKEIRELKADIKHDAKVCEDYEDGLLSEIDKLKAENEELRGEVKALNLVINQRNEENSAEIKSLQEQLKDAVNDYESLLNHDSVK